MPPNMPKFAICISLPMQCIINLCSKTNKTYTDCNHFQCFSYPKSICRRAEGRSPSTRTGTVLAGTYEHQFGACTYRLRPAGWTAGPRVTGCLSDCRKNSLVAIHTAAIWISCALTSRNVFATSCIYRAYREESRCRQHCGAAPYQELTTTTT